MILYRGKNHTAKALAAILIRERLDELPDERADRIKGVTVSTHDEHRATIAEIDAYRERILDLLEKEVAATAAGR